MVMLSDSEFSSNEDDFDTGVLLLLLSTDVVLSPLKKEEASLDVLPPPNETLTGLDEGVVFCDVLCVFSKAVVLTFPMVALVVAKDVLALVRSISLLAVFSGADVVDVVDDVVVVVGAGVVVVFVFVF